MRQMIFVMVRIQLLDQFIADLNILGTEENIFGCLEVVWHGMPQKTVSIME